MVIAVDYSRQITLPGELLHNRAVTFYITDKNESLLAAGELIALLRPIFSPDGNITTLMNLFDSHKQPGDIVDPNHPLVQLNDPSNRKSIEDKLQATCSFINQSYRQTLLRWRVYSGFALIYLPFYCKIVLRLSEREEYLCSK